MLTSPAGPAQSMPLIDRALVADLAGMLAPAEFIDLVETFQSDAVARLAGLREAVARGDRMGAGRLAHALAGSAAAIGAALVEAEARAMMHALPDAAALDRLEGLVAQSLAALSALARAGA